MSWSPQQYSKFEAERNRPIFDLLSQVPQIEVKTAADLGCGPGNSTEFLQNRFPNATILGMDNSPEMVEAAKKRLPAVDFEVADIATWEQPGPFEILLANASLQWVPNQEAVLPFLLSKVSPSGILAYQVPDNWDEPAHTLMRAVASQPAFVEKLGTVAAAQPPRRPAEWHYRLLLSHAGEVNVWRTTYFHRLADGHEGIVEWFKGTGLRPYLSPLSAEEQTSFLAEYTRRLMEAYSPLEDGSVLLPFPRLFAVATR